MKTALILIGLSSLFATAFFWMACAITRDDLDHDRRIDRE